MSSGVTVGLLLLDTRVLFGPDRGEVPETRSVRQPDFMRRESGKV